MHGQATKTGLIFIDPSTANESLTVPEGLWCIYTITPEFKCIWQLLQLSFWNSLKELSKGTVATSSWAQLSCARVRATSSRDLQPEQGGSWVLPKQESAHFQPALLEVRGVRHKWTPQPDSGLSDLADKIASIGSVFMLLLLLCWKMLLFP